jgi:hypothetical protein
MKLLSVNNLITDFKDICNRKKFNHNYNDWIFPYEFVEMNDEALCKILFQHRCVTGNMIAEIRDQKDWDNSEQKKAQIHTLDVIFRWEYLNRVDTVQSVCLLVRGEATTKERYPDQHEMMSRLYMLLRFEKDCIIGLSTFKSYQEHE